MKHFGTLKRGEHYVRLGKWLVRKANYQHDRCRHLRLIVPVELINELKWYNLTYVAFRTAKGQLVVKKAEFHV